LSKFKEGKKRSIVASVTYLLLSASKIILGLLFSSLVVYADGIHSITDFLTGIVVFVGLSLAERPVSEEFPFGMYKAENLASLLVAIVMAYAGIDIIRSSLFSGFSAIRYPLMLILLEAISCIVTYWLSRYLSKTPGVKLYSVKAEGLHAYQDTLISLGVIMGVLGEWFNYQYLGNAVAVGVAAYILYQSYFIGRDSLLILLDISDKGAVEDIKKVVYTISEVVGVHEIKVRRTGPFLVASMHLEVPPSLSVKEADELADVVEKKLKESIDSLVYVSIHIEPGSFSGKWRIALLVDKDGSLVKNVKDAEKVIIVDTWNKVLEEFNLNKGDLRAVAEHLKKRKVGAIITNSKDDLLIMKAYGIGVYYSPVKDVKESLGLFRQGALDCFINN